MITFEKILNNHINLDGSLKDGYVLISYPNDVVTHIKAVKDNNGWKLTLLGPTEYGDKDAVIYITLKSLDQEIDDYLIKFFYVVG